MGTLILILTLILLTLAILVAWWLIRDVDPPKPGRHRTPQEPLHGNDEPRPEAGDLP